MLYYVKNKSGNISDVTERIYKRCQKDDEYECWAEDPYKEVPKEVEENKVEETPPEGYGTSTDHTIRELNDMRASFSDEDWKEFTKNDERKSVPE